MASPPVYYRDMVTRKALVVQLRSLNTQRTDDLLRHISVFVSQLIYRIDYSNYYSVTPVDRECLIFATFLFGIVNQIIET